MFGKYMRRKWRVVGSGDGYGYNVQSSILGILWETHGLYGWHGDLNFSRYSNIEEAEAAAKELAEEHQEEFLRKKRIAEHAKKIKKLGRLP